MASKLRRKLFACSALMSRTEAGRKMAAHTAGFVIGATKAGAEREFRYLAQDSKPGHKIEGVTAVEIDSNTITEAFFTCAEETRGGVRP